MNPDVGVCLYCGGAVSQDAADCPHCGRDLASTREHPLPFTTYPPPFSEGPPAPGVPAPPAASHRIIEPIPEPVAPTPPVELPPTPPAPSEPVLPPSPSPSPSQEPLPPPPAPPSVPPSPLSGLGLSEVDEAEIAIFVRNGMKIRAIKCLREKASLDLGAAKEIVDKLDSIIGPPPHARFGAGQAVSPVADAVFEAPPIIQSAGVPSGVAAGTIFPGLSLPESVESTICSLIMAGHRTMATAMLRDNTRLGFADAKMRVDRAALLMGAPRSTNAGCYIATACYGDYDHPDVKVLRRFRDKRLARTAAGRLAVKTYYALSPALASHLGRYPHLAGLIRRKVLEPLVDRLGDR